MYTASVIADSISPHGHRMTTMEITMPRFILPQFNKHRMLSSNAASSRALPTEKLIDQVKFNAFIPEFNQRVKGMGVGPALDGEHARFARDAWLTARNEAVRAAERLMALNVDKSRVNRLLEPFMWITLLVSATDWSNLFALRANDDAQPEFQRIAALMRDTYQATEPWYCPAGRWHIPLVDLEELGAQPDYNHWKAVSTGRCARVSYLTHDGRRDPAADVGLRNRLLADSHLSPFEHLAQPFSEAEWEFLTEEQEELRTWWRHKQPRLVERWCRQLEYCGNLRGWRSYRSEIPDEHDFSLASAA